MSRRELDETEHEVSGTYRTYSKILRRARKIERETLKNWLDGADEQTQQAALRLHQAATMDYILNHSERGNALRLSMTKRAEHAKTTTKHSTSKPKSTHKGKWLTLLDEARKAGHVVAAKLAALADEHGTTINGVARDAALLKLAKIKSVSDADIQQASSLVRQYDKDLESRVASHNRKIDEAYGLTDDPAPIEGEDGKELRRDVSSVRSERKAQKPLFEETTVKVKHAELVTLLEGLDVRTASKWANDRLLRKVESLPKMAEASGDDVAKLDDASKKLLKKLLKAVENEEEVEIVGGGDDAADESDEKEESSSKKKGSKKSSKKDEDADDDSDEEDEDADDGSETEDDDEEEEKPKKKSSKKESAADKKSSKKKSAKKDEDADDDEDTVPVHKKSSKKKDSDKQPSNKERIYKLWLKSKKEDPIKLKKLAKADVEDQTVKNWARRWAKGKGLPACARKE